MSINPFSADPAVPARLSLVDDATRNSIRLAAQDALASQSKSTADNDGGVIPHAAAQAMVARFGLHSIRDLMCLLLDVAEEYANPQISDFHVGVVGLEAATGNLILGGNVEFPGSHLGFTLHGEGFVFCRAMSRGVDLSVIAIDEAHPCAHCRQCLAEYAASDRLELIDPLGHTLTMAQIYPWPFDPGYLGEPGAVPGRELWPALAFAGPVNSADADLVLAAGRRSHSPYSKCPGALVLRLRDGAAITGIAIESVAFNPTIQPVQTAMVDLLAHGYRYEDIVGATLGTVLGGDVDYSVATRELLARVAPGVTLTVLGWTL